MGNFLHQQEISPTPFHAHCNVLLLLQNVPEDKKDLGLLIEFLQADHFVLQATL